MDARVVTVLSIEADKAVADFVCASLERTSTQNQNLPSFEVVRATRLSDGLSHLDGASFDVVLAELDLPDSCPEETLARLREHTPDLPIVILTERLDVELARRMVRAGVSDYLFKHELNGPLLAHALASVVEREPPTPEDAARTGHDTPVACESCHARIFESLPDPAILWRRRQGGEIVMAAVNPAARALTDEKIDVYLGQPLESVFSHDPNAVEMVRSTFDEGEVRRGEGSYHVRTTGEDKWFLADAIRLTEDVVLNVARDTTAWRASEDALRRAEREKALVLGTVSDMVAYYESPDLRIAWANQAAARSVGFTMEALQGRHCYEVWHAREEPCEECPVLAAFRTGACGTCALIPT
jgi:PAS domain-containing protein